MTCLRRNAALFYCEANVWLILNRNACNAALHHSSNDWAVVCVTCKAIPPFGWSLSLLDVGEKLLLTWLSSTFQMIKITSFNWPVANIQFVSYWPCWGVLKHSWGSPEHPGWTYRCSICRSIDKTPAYWKTTQQIQMSSIPTLVVLHLIVAFIKNTQLKEKRQKERSVGRFQSSWHRLAWLHSASHYNKFTTK